MELGISIYPGHSDQEKDAAYLKLASKYGCKHVFTCLLSVEGSREKIVANFRDSIALAHSYGMEVMLDTAPSVFEALGASYDDLSFFKELGADGIRLDECFDSHKEAMMTYNPQGLTIEINAGFGDRYIDNIMCHHPKRENYLPVLIFIHRDIQESATAITGCAVKISKQPGCLSLCLSIPRSRILLGPGR